MITCIHNQKQYVGMTTKSLNRRWLEHRMNAQRGLNSALYNAIRKHGCESFSANELEKCETIGALRIAENRWIEQLQTQAPLGYNLSAGGEGNPGYKFTPQQLITKSNAQKNSEKFRRISVVQLDAFGFVVARFRTMQEAQQQTGIAHIAAVVHGRRRHAGGFIWCSTERLDEIQTKIREGQINTLTLKPLYQIDRIGAIIDRFESSIEAYHSTKIRHIPQALQSSTHYAGGFFWITVADYIAGERAIIKNEDLD